MQYPTLQVQIFIELNMVSPLCSFSNVCVGEGGGCLEWVRLTYGENNPSFSIKNSNFLQKLVEIHFYIINHHDFKNLHMSIPSLIIFLTTPMFIAAIVSLVFTGRIQTRILGVLKSSIHNLDFIRIVKLYMFIITYNRFLGCQRLIQMAVFFDMALVLYLKQIFSIQATLSHHA